jgi:hypothetical protein
VCVQASWIPKEFLRRHHVGFFLHTLSSLPEEALSIDSVRMTAVRVGACARAAKTRAPFHSLCGVTWCALRLHVLSSSRVPAAVLRYCCGAQPVPHV